MPPTSPVPTFQKHPQARCRFLHSHPLKLSLRGCALQSRFRWTGPIRMQTSKNFLPTSIPAHRSTLTSSMTLSLRREANAFFIGLAFRALLAPIGGSFASARPLYLTGFSPKTTDRLLSSSYVPVWMGKSWKRSGKPNKVKSAYEVGSASLFRF